VLGKRIDTSDSPMRVYARLEIGVGLYALLTGPLLLLVRAAWSAVAGRAELGPGAGTLLKLVLSAAVLLLPAFLMGSTLPALRRAVSASRGRARPLIPLLYGLNTLGAVAGTAATGFFLLERLGLSRTMLLAAALNLLVGGAVLLLARRAPPNPERAEASPRLLESLRALVRAKGGAYACTGLFVSGATTMLYEIVFVRVLGLVFGVS